jgi:cytochrome b561
MPISAGVVKGVIMIPNRNSASYSGRQKIFHWTIAIAVLAIIPAGLIMNRIGEGPAQNQLYDLHRSFGFIVLLLAALRLRIRMSDGAPEPAADLTAFERVASVTVHRLLYALLLLMPIVGWAAMSAYGGEWSVFHLFMPPPLVPKNEQLSDALFRLHEFGGFIMAALVSVHIAAAIFHGFIRRDGVLARMLPGSARQGL